MMVFEKARSKSICSWMMSTADVYGKLSAPAPALRRWRQFQCCRLIAAKIPYDSKNKSICLGSPSNSVAVKNIIEYTIELDRTSCCVSENVGITGIHEGGEISLC
jgi:hypothetical protein